MEVHFRFQMTTGTKLDLMSARLYLHSCKKCTQLVFDKKKLRDDSLLTVQPVGVTTITTSYWGASTLCNNVRSQKLHCYKKG